MKPLSWLDEFNDLFVRFCPTGKRGSQSADFVPDRPAFVKPDGLLLEGE